MSHRVKPSHLEIVKTILWGVMGVWAVVTVARFAHGIGATSGLTDVAPWGFWIAFDVMAGVALAAGGFVVAAIVYIFGVERYHAFARPAILTALLGYIAVAMGLLYDLGVPWRIWHPMIMPQHHSVLFEVAMCVMLYLTVLALEFSPAVLEHPLFGRPLFQKLLRIIRKFTIPLVIAGIVLSTLHQSSLGSLFLIQPFRVHPLWYSKFLYVWFFVSAVGLGLMMVTLESLISAWLFGHKIDVPALAGFGILASIVLSGYVIIRVADLVAQGTLPAALDGSWQAGLFVFEIAVSAVIPAVLLTIPRVRNSIPGLATCSLMVVLGVIGHRFNTAIVVFARPDTMGYWPTWTEIAISAGIVSGAALVFIFFNENLRIVEHHADEDAPEEPPPPVERKGPDLGATVGAFTPTLRRHSLAFVLAAGAAFALLPRDAVFGPEPVPTPVRLARNINALVTRVPAEELPESGATTRAIRQRFYLSNLTGDVPAELDPQPVRLTLIDGNRAAKLAPFTHDKHAEVLGGEESCRICHHANMTFDVNTACYQCHRDMYETTDIFEHQLHVDSLGGNAACTVCHERDWARKSRETALACWECHGGMIVPGSIIEPPEEGLVGYAPGYEQAMHGLCVKCHEQLAQEKPEIYGAAFGRCDVCHRFSGEAQYRMMAPYVPMPPGHRHEHLWDAPTREPAQEPVELVEAGDSSSIERRN
jgi:Ni/Fe-hydrogenase subunit HybB-like protein